MSNLRGDRQNQSHPSPTISNVIINSVMCTDSIFGECTINEKPVKFLFDTGTVKTILAERIWYKSKRGDEKLTPLNATIETCSGGAIQVIGTSKCSLKVKNFNGEVEVVIVKKLVYDCLLGLDVAFKMADVKSQLNSIREVLGSKQLPPESHPKQTKLESELPQIYRRPVNAVSETKSDSNNDSEIETEKAPKTERDTIDMYKTILHDEFQDVVSAGLESLTQTDLCEHSINLTNDQPIRQPV
ncbi:unnamed protein product [Brachionus calyciflorus]|uniref:Peptidase A2 domain-containing protein n=1 Tax=Brachionus calyciflorus TaxID=104777 RepID=A0A813Z020_9BILA|nr:unnamed protein product [Brachionus calyciflorus]